MTRALLSLLAVLLLCQCDTTRSINRADTGAWNPNRTWRPVAGSRTDFIPADLPPATLSRTPGAWVADPQDGLRFFIPQNGTPKYPQGVLQGEAYKATNRRTLASQRARNALAVALMPVHIVTLGMPRRWSGHGGSGGGGGADHSSFDDDDSWPDSQAMCRSDRDQHRDRDHDRHESRRHDDDRRDSSRDERRDDHRHDDPRRNDRSDDRKSDDKSDSKSDPRRDP